MKKKLRHIIQLVFTVLCNGYLIGFQKGVIFQGSSKMFCLPVLNCYSCPGALGACPIGALQAVLGDRKYHFSFYVLGTLMLFGILGGRIICAFLCPFGFVQELLHKIRTPKLSIPRRIDKPLRYTKYLILIGFVVIGPLFLTNYIGMGKPYFCKLICPAGTLGGGIPLVSANETLQRTIGWLFNWKVAVLVLVLISSIFIYRPFCKYICPLGALYSLFNRFSFYQLEIDRNKCSGCGACERTCKMNVRIMHGMDIEECIRCGECSGACPRNAIKMKWIGGKNNDKNYQKTTFEDIRTDDRSCADRDGRM